MPEPLGVPGMKEYEEFEEGVGGEAFEVPVDQFIDLVYEVGVRDAQTRYLQQHRHDPHLGDRPRVAYDGVEKELAKALVKAELGKLEILPEEIYQQMQRKWVHIVIGQRVGDFIGEGGLIGVYNALVAYLGQVEQGYVQVEDLHVVGVLEAAGDTPRSLVLPHLVVGREEHLQELHI